LQLYLIVSVNQKYNKLRCHTEVAGCFVSFEWWGYPMMKKLHECLAVATKSQHVTYKIATA